MILFVNYDPKEGRILGRIKSTNPEILKNYDHTVVITETEYQAEPEVYKKVDLQSKKLVDKD